MLERLLCSPGGRVVIMTNAAMNDAGTVTFIERVRLQTWFFLIAFPLLGSILVLLAGTALVTRGRVQELEQIQRDGTSIAALERLIVTLAVENREVVGSLLPASSSGQGEARVAQAELDEARASTERAFTNSMTNLATDRSEEGTETSASDPEALRTSIDRMRAAENRAASSALARRSGQAIAALVQADSINKALSTELVNRFQIETVELQQTLASLASEAMFNRATLGSARVRVDTLNVALEQLSKEMMLARSFQLLLTHLDAGSLGVPEDDAHHHQALTADVNTALKNATEGSHDRDSRVDLLVLESEIRRVLKLVDSVEFLRRSDPRDPGAALLSRRLDEYV